MDVIRRLKYGQDGLIPAVVQDYRNGEVLMVAWMNEESLRQTLDTGLVTFWSRSRCEFWVKGKTSGHVQRLKEIFVDCDSDCLLIKAEQEGAACHEGFRTCFFSRLESETDSLVTVGKPLRSKEEIYGVK